MSLAGLGGQLDVHLVWREGQVCDVHVNNARPKQISRIFIGKPAHEVVELIPMIYSLCGVAQKVAALQAIESCMGYQASQTLCRARGFVVAAEGVRELVLRVLDGWIEDEHQLRAKVTQWFSAVNQQFGWALTLAPTNELVERGDRAEQQEAVCIEFTQTLAAMLAQIGVETLGADAGINGSEVRVNSDLKGLFTSPSIKLGDASQALDLSSKSIQAELLEALKKPSAFGFCAQPSLNESCFENSLFTLSKLSKHLKYIDNETLGNTLARRYVSLIQTLRSLPEQMLKQPEQWLIASHFAGLGLVKAARGGLAHYAKLNHQQQLLEYQVVAPTDWNFHPKGTLFQMLKGASVTEEQLPLLVNTLIKLVDPCVQWQLTLDTKHA